MHSLEPVHLAAGAGEDRAALSGHPRKANAGQYDSVMQQRPLAAVVGEDRAALSGRPRKANASQYEIVLQHRNPVRNRDSTTSSSKKS